MLMQNVMRLIVLITLVFCTVQDRTLAGQSDASKERIDRAKNLWDIEQMLAEHCERLAVHYNLDASQKANTSKLLADRVNRFLDRHDKEIWPLLLELTELQYTGSNPEPDAAKRIASKGYHIFLEAKDEILRGQNAFRKDLNDDQKKVHDRDLKGLEYHFNALERQFKAWNRGEVNGSAPLSNVRFGPNRPLIPEPPNIKRADKAFVESEWERYVRSFIRNYRLDDEQKSKALAILKDLKNRAAQYRKTNKKDLQEAAQYLQEARSSKPLDLDELDQARMIWDLMNKPFDDMFNELKKRLEQIPTEKQKGDYYKRYPGRNPSNSKIIPIKPKKKAGSSQTTSGPKKTKSKPAKKSGGQEGKKTK